MWGCKGLSLQNEEKTKNKKKQPTTRFHFCAGRKVNMVLVGPRSLHPDERSPGTFAGVKEQLFVVSDLLHCIQLLISVAASKLLNTLEDQRKVRDWRKGSIHHQGNNVNVTRLGRGVALRLHMLRVQVGVLKVCTSPPPPAALPPCWVDMPEGLMLDLSVILKPDPRWSLHVVRRTAA